MAVSRTFDATALNAIVNHPTVFPHVAGALEGLLDIQSGMTFDFHM